MLRLFFRRTLAALPALLLATVGLFVLVAAAPTPSGLTEEEAARRFLDLPVLFNVDPQDRPRIVESAVARLATDEGPERTDDVTLLLRIGAAGLPDLVAAMDRLSLDGRARLARELAPLAFRMGLEDVADLDAPAKADRFWRRALDDRGPELRPASVRRALRRHLAARAEPLYARQLSAADTALLAPLLEALGEPQSREDRDEIETLAIAATIRAGATDVSDGASLQTWWDVHRARYVELDPVGRVAAHFGETRLGRWVFSAIRHRLGNSWRTDAPVLHDLEQHAPATLLRALIAVLLAHLLALPLAAVAAARRGSSLDRITSAATIVAYALPAFVVVLLLRASVGVRAASSDVLLVSALALAAIAPITRHARAAFLEVLGQDYVRAARAKGLSVAAVWLRHVVRNALGPIVALASIQLPIALGATLVAEDVLGVDGLGVGAMEAIRAHDLPWLMGFSVGVAGLTMLALVVGDVAQAAVDPRARAALAGRPDHG
ncbi:MAG: hypothetical protein NVS3B10_05030 [Polyangiales bacterium]